MKTLRTLQNLSKIGKIISKIIFIFCLIGSIGCIVGIICLAVIPDGFKLGGMTIHGIIEKNAEISISIDDIYEWAQAEPVRDFCFESSEYTNCLHERSFTIS